MSMYSLLLKSSGLSQKEAAEFHDVSVDTIKSWSSGRRMPPDGVSAEMMEFCNTLRDVLTEIMNRIIERAQFVGPAVVVPLFTDSEAYTAENGYDEFLCKQLARLQFDSTRRVVLGLALSALMATGHVVTYVDETVAHPAELRFTRLQPR